MFIDGADAALIKEGENVTFINWGNLRYVANEYRVPKGGTSIAGWFTKATSFGYSF